MFRVLFASLVTAAVLFAWGAVVDTLLPIGTLGIRTLPDEPGFVASLDQITYGRGFYVFPAKDLDGDPETQDDPSFEERYLSGPRGLLVVHPGGDEYLSPNQMGTDFVAKLVAALLAAIVLSRTSGTSYLGRLFLVTCLGAFAFAVVGVPMWNWFHYPLEFVQAAAIETVAGWFLAGIFLAGLVGKKK